jgi:hypothetical protein
VKSFSYALLAGAISSAIGIFAASAVRRTPRVL